MGKIKYKILTENIFKGENNKYYYFYNITNLKNGKKYWGVHSTFNLNDGYKGSGYALNKEMKDISLDNYEKNIFKFFKNKDEMYKYETIIVTKDMVKNNNCYNMHTGGSGSWDFTLGRVTVKDESGKCFLVDLNDDRYVNGELKHNMTGMVHVIDTSNNNKHITITKKEYHNNKDRYKCHISGNVLAKINDEVKWISKEEYDEKNKLGIIHGHTKGKGVFKDKNGNILMCDLNDKRVLSGELVGSTKGLSVYKYKNDFSRICQTTPNDPRVVSGELVGINYGIVFCINPKTGERLKVSKNDERLKTGEIWSVTKYNIHIKKIKGEKITNNKSIKTKEVYKKENPDIIKLFLENKTINEIEHLTKLPKSKIQYIIKRYKKAP